MSETKWRAAKYLRISETDDKKNDDREQESNSIASQRKLLDRFIAGQPDIEAVCEKIDDGVSGVIFDCKAFKEMMADIEAGNINCVLERV